MKDGKEIEIMNSKTGIRGSEFYENISELILNSIDALVYAINIDNFQILYMNQQAKQVYGNGVGTVCWQWIQKNKNSPCANCALKNLIKESEQKQRIISEQYNILTNSWYEIHEMLVDWPGMGKAKLQIAYPINHRKREEVETAHLFDQQELYAKIASTFNLDRTFADKVNEVLGIVGNFVKVSRVSIFENLPWKQKSCLTYEWCNVGILPKINRLREIIFKTDLSDFKLHHHNELLIINDLLKFEGSNIYHAFIKFSVRSMLFLPLFLREKHIGFVNFEVCDEARIWQDDEIQLLKTLGNIISTAFERKNLEEKRLRTELSLWKANATKDKFFSIISRDLIDPYSSVISLANMLLENYLKWNDEKRLLFINSIRESSNQGYKLLENLIIWSKIQSGTISFFPTDVDIRSAISLAIEQLKENADNKKIKITGIPEELIFVYADYHMLHCVFKNLLSNAIKFTPEHGEIVLNHSKYDDFIEISVCDNGIGIEKANIHSLFKIDRFTVDYTPADEKGTGLGLIICREFVEKNGGRIWVESKLGEGSCFKFTIPVSK